MTHTLQRAKLARAAAVLNARAGYAGLLPPLMLMTDDARLPDPLAAAALLPRGSLVIVRSRNSGRRRDLARDMLKLAQRRHLLVSVADDPVLALSAGADGLHLPQARLAEAADWRARSARLLITVAAHAPCDIAGAARARADAALLSPVFATGSHPGAPTLGPIRVRLMLRAALLPVYALGGIDDRNVMRLSGAPLAGIAAIGALRAEGPLR